MQQNFHIINSISCVTSFFTKKKSYSYIAILPLARANHPFKVGTFLSTNILKIQLFTG